jgi:hypothetical protein
LEWLEKLIPDKRRTSDPRGMVTIGDWTTCTNTHALLTNAGTKGQFYPDFTPFSAVEVKKFIGLYILQGLSPSPQVKMKFKTHHVDSINGNDLCNKVIMEMTYATRSLEVKENGGIAF